MKPCTPSTKRIATPREQRPGEVVLVDPVDDGVDAERGGDERADDAERDADPLDRLRPEAGEHVERQPGQPERRVARGAFARRVTDVDLGHARAAGEHERLRELLLADRRQHRLDRLAAICVERAAEVGDGDAGEAAQHAVDQLRRERPAPRVAPGDAPTARHVGAGVDRRDEQRDVLRPVLEVAVHRHDDLTARPDEARVHRRVLPEVPPEADGANAGIGGVQTLELREGAVRRSVVDEDQLPRPAELLERLRGAAVELVERAGLVVEGDDDRDHAMRDASSTSPSTAPRRRSRPSMRQLSASYDAASRCSLSSTRDRHVLAERRLGHDMLATQDVADAQVFGERAVREPRSELVVVDDVPARRSDRAHPLRAPSRAAPNAVPGRPRPIVVLAELPLEMRAAANREVEDLDGNPVSEEDEPAPECLVVAAADAHVRIRPVERP